MNEERRNRDRKRLGRVEIQRVIKRERGYCEEMGVE
jgi:hypothetical protein